MTASDIFSLLRAVACDITNKSLTDVFLRYSLSLPVVARPCTRWLASQTKTFALCGGEAIPCWRAPPDRGCEFQDVMAVKDLIVVCYTSRWCHNMIPLSVNVLAHSTSLCAHASAISPRFRSVFAISDPAQKVMYICLCDQLQLVSLSYKPFIPSQTLHISSDYIWLHFLGSHFLKSTELGSDRRSTI